MSLAGVLGQGLDCFPDDPPPQGLLGLLPQPTPREVFPPPGRCSHPHLCPMTPWTLAYFLLE